MTLIWKDVLWPGRWTYPDGRELRLTPAAVENTYRQSLAMGRAGLDIPWNWEHQPDSYPRPVEMSAGIFSDPQRRADWARNTIAPVAGFQLRRTRRGPVLYAAINTERLSPDEVERIRRAGKVSCRLDENFRDGRGDGRFFPGFCVSHVAVTPKPVEPNQGPFLMSTGPADRTYYLGHAVPDMAKDDDTPPPKDDEADDADAIGGDDAGDAKPAGGQAGKLQSILDSLAGCGITLPADVVTNLDSLDMALKVYAATKQGQPGGDDQGLPATAGDAGATQPGASPPMMMSQAEMQRKYPHRVANDREELRAKIKRQGRAGKVSPKVTEGLLREFEGFEMSYQSDGTVAPTDLVARVDAYDKLPAGMVIAPKQPDSHAKNKQTKILDRPAEFDQPSRYGEIPDTADDLERKQQEAVGRLMPGAAAK